MLTPAIAHAHATLIASEPAANAHLAESPRSIHLTFSEQVVPRLCQITIVSASGQKFTLDVVGDPHNVRAISAIPTRLRPGSYALEWRVLSADGHPATGSFAFVVGEELTSAARDSVPQIPAAAVPVDSGVVQTSVAPRPPTFLAALRGAATAALLGAAGLLLLALRGNGAQSGRPARYCVILIVAAAALFSAHLIGWLANTAPDGRLTADWASTVVGTAPGVVESGRTLLVILAAWALVLARRVGLARAIASAAVVASGAAGHAAAVIPVVSIPLKSIHLVAVSIWFGGLLWLVLSTASDANFSETSWRVSRAALISVIVLAVTGVIQALLIAPLPELIQSNYGLVLAIKTALFLGVVAFGAYNRFRIMPAIDGPAAGDRLRASAARESTLMVLVLLVAGLLAYTPTPQP